MPRSAPTRCTEPSCGALATHRHRCPDHQRAPWVYESKRNQLIDKTRWNRVRHAHLGREPQCVRCGSTEQLQVDHIIEVTDNGSLYDPSNLQTLCSDCHAEKTKAQARKRHIT